MSGGEQPSACHAEIVDFRVETNKADSTIIDLYRGYPILGWSVQEVDDRYRHDVSVLWDPYDDTSRRFADSASMQPLIIHACPAGGTESVLACSGSRCDVYPDEASVPAVTLPTMRLQLSAPWGYSDIRELAEGETLDIPLSYEVGQDDLSADYGVSVEFRFFQHSRPSLTRTVHRTPERATLQIRPGGPRTGTVSFQLSTDRDDVSQGDEDLLVSYNVGRVVGTSVSGSPGVRRSPTGYASDSPTGDPGLLDRRTAVSPGGGRRRPPPGEPAGGRRSRPSPHSSPSAMRPRRSRGFHHRGYPGATTVTSQVCDAEPSAVLPVITTVVVPRPVGVTFTIGSRSGPSVVTSAVTTSVSLETAVTRAVAGVKMFAM